MGIRIGNVPTSTLNDTDNIIFAEGEAPRKTLYSEIKKDILGTETLTTTAQSVKGAINEHETDIIAINASLSDMAKNICKLSLGVNYSIAPLTWYGPMFTTIEVDNNNMAQLASNAIYVRKAGTYMISAFVQWDPSADGEKLISVSVNGTRQSDLRDSMKAFSSGTVLQYQNLTCLKKFNAGDLIALQVYHTSASSASVSSTTTFGIVRIGA